MCEWVPEERNDRLARGVPPATTGTTGIAHEPQRLPQVLRQPRSGAVSGVCGGPRPLPHRALPARSAFRNVQRDLRPGLPVGTAHGY